MKYRSQKIPEMWARLEWCRSIFGIENENITWCRKKGRIHFLREQDLLLFILKWS